MENEDADSMLTDIPELPSGTFPKKKSMGDHGPGHKWSKDPLVN